MALGLFETLPLNAKRAVWLIPSHLFLILKHLSNLIANGYLCLWSNQSGSLQWLERRSPNCGNGLCYERSWNNSESSRPCHGLHGHGVLVNESSAIFQVQLFLGQSGRWELLTNHPCRGLTKTKSRHLPNGRFLIADTYFEMLAECWLQKWGNLPLGFECAYGCEQKSMLANRQLV